jgi:hypothetical protein
MLYDDYYASPNDNDIMADVQKKLDKLEFAITDKYHEKFVRHIHKKWHDGKYYDKMTVSVFGSGQHGSRIRNAVTGLRTPYLVGSKDEDLFFKVTDAKGYKNKNESLTLFYDSPEQFENHQFTLLSQPTKEQWLQKNVLFRQNLLINS